MTVESATYINGLDATYPASTDLKSEGDNHLRLIKTILKRCFAGFTGHVVVTGTDGGAANAYTVTPATAVAEYVSRTIVIFSPTVANTGASTIAVSSLAAKDLKSCSGADLISGELSVGGIYAAIYNGTNFRLLSPTKQYIDQLAFNTALPDLTGNDGNWLTVENGVALWKQIPMLSAESYFMAQIGG